MALTKIKTSGIADNAITNAKMADDAIDSADFANASIDNVHVATGLDAVKLADGTVTNTEFQYINTLSSNAQTQISAKSPTAGNASLVTVGTIGTGVWQGTAVASAYLDADTAHLSGSTFSGDINVEKANPTITLASASTQQANSGRIVFSEHASGTNDYFEIYHDGNANELVIESYEKDDILKFARVTGNATFAGIVTAPSLILTPGSAPTATEGAMYYDSTDDIVKVRTASSWVTLNNISYGVGGIESEYFSGGVSYKVHTFLSSGTFTTMTAIVADIFVVAGGGAGGSGSGVNGTGGGGAGGVCVQTDRAMSASYTVIIGAGGAQNGGNNTGGNGNNSTFDGITAVGGGGGSAYLTTSGGSRSLNYVGIAGGSGGGGGAVGSSAGGSGTQADSDGATGYGNAGGAGHSDNRGGGGGGGAGGVGDTADSTTWSGGEAGDGGAGIQNDFRTGSNVYYAGGGGASMADRTTGQGDGQHGGGHGQRNSVADTNAGSAGTANTGGGGGGGRSQDGYDGGSGIVIIRYAI